MRTKKITLPILILIMIMCLLFPPNIFAAWTTQIVDGTNNVGRYTSIAAPAANTIYISYRDHTNSDLKFTKSVDNGATWASSIVTSTGNVGEYSSISTAGAADIFIAYKDDTSNRARVAVSADSGGTWSLYNISATGQGDYVRLAAANSTTLFAAWRGASNKVTAGKSIDGGVTWTTSVIDSSVNATYCSIHALDVNRVFIAYYDTSNGDLRVAKTSDGGTTWTLSLAASAGNIGAYNSIYAITDQIIYVSYYDNTNSDLKFVKTTNGGTTWNTPVTVDSAGNTGLWTSLTALDVNTIYISFYDNSTSDLNVAKSINSGTVWTVDPVDTTGNVGEYTSIATYTASNIFVSYYDASAGDLKLASDITAPPAPPTPSVIVPTTTVTQTTGIAVQGTQANTYVGVKDVSFGDTQTSGLPSVGMFVFNGATWDRVRGDSVNGIRVQMTSAPSGTTNIQGTQSDNSVNVTTKLPVIPARANAASPSWTEGYQVPLSVDLAGNLRVTPFNIPAGGLGVNTAISSSFAHNQVLVNNLGAVILAANANRKSAVIRNIGSTLAYIGGASVSTSNGYPVLPNESHIFDRSTGAIYGITSAGSTTFSYIEE